MYGLMHHVIIFVKYNAYGDSITFHYWFSSLWVYESIYFGHIMFKAY